MTGWHKGIYVYDPNVIDNYCIKIMMTGQHKGIYVYEPNVIATVIIVLRYVMMTGQHKGIIYI